MLVESEPRQERTELLRLLLAPDAPPKSPENLASDSDHSAKHSRLLVACYHRANGGPNRQAARRGASELRHGDRDPSVGEQVHDLSRYVADV